MGSERLLSTLILDFSRLTREMPVAGVVSTTVDNLSEMLGRARVAIWLSGPVEGAMVAHSSAGLDSAGKARYVFSEPLTLRGVSYGHMQVEVMRPAIDFDALPIALQTIALQLALYAERYRLEQRRAALRRQVAQLRSALTTDKAASRAAGIVARARGIAVSDGRRWLLAESARRGRTLLSVAEGVIAGELGPGMPGIPGTRQRASKGEFAA